MVVVMEAGTASCEATSSPRNWYPENGSQPQTTSNPSSSSTDQLDAYFKGSNATTAAYFSQMQAGAYPGMSYHGNFLGF